MNQPSQNLPNKKRQQNKFNNSASSASSGGAGTDLLGRVPPHSVEAEQGVLGGVLRRGDALHNVADVLTEYDFYLPAHQFIYAAFLDLFNKKQPIDALTVAEQLIARGQLDEAG